MARYVPKEGWVNLWRRIESHRFWPTYENRPFTKLEAWLWLLLRASYKKRTVEFMGKKWELHPGDIVTSQRILAERWKWSRSSVRRFLEELYLNEEATHLEAHGVTHLTICGLMASDDTRPRPRPTFRPTIEEVQQEGEESPFFFPDRVRTLVRDVVDNMGISRKKKGD